ncbi:MAG: lamin tail domain-containing protein [Patescibacteria group bacterium]|nr:lamin tail domain-containing protein [Patescibacteria group bacterium]
MKKTKTKIKFFFLIILLLSGFFVKPQVASAADSDLIINEIGAYEQSENEWVEILNKGTAAVDMTGWKFYEDQTNHKLTAVRGDFIIEAGEYAIIANVGNNFINLHPNFTGTVLDSSWSSLKESGEEIGLKNSSGEPIETFTYLPCPDTSLQRVDQNSNDYGEANWLTHASSNSAGKPNEFSQNDGDQNQGPDNNEEGEEEQNGGESGDTGEKPNDNPEEPAQDSAPVIHPKIISLGTVVINEFVSDPADGEVEWVEIYNKNVFDIDLSGWKLIDGADTATELSGILGSNYDNRFFVIEKPKGKLNNAGDALILKDSNNNTIDAVSYGNWDNGFADQNAPVAKDPDSTARIFDGANSYNNREDFVVTQTPTKGTPNLITLTEEAKKVKQEKDTQLAAEEGRTDEDKNIIINEIYPNPIGSDLEDEFIELKNIGKNEIDLAGWKINDGSKKKYTVSKETIGETAIKPGQFMIIKRSVSGIALNNDKDSVKLINPSGQTLETIKYDEDETVPENVSFARDENGDWFWTTSPTENQENIIVKLNHAPEIDFTCTKSVTLGEEIICDASDSYDLDNDELSFNWQIEDKNFDGPITSYKYEKAGTYTIALTVNDGKEETSDSQKVKVVAPAKEAAPKTSKTTTKAKSAKTTAKTQMNQAGSSQIEPNNQGKNVLKYLLTSAAFLGLGVVAVTRKKKKPHANSS